VTVATVLEPAPAPAPAPAVTSESLTNSASGSSASGSNGQVARHPFWDAQPVQRPGDSRSHSHSHSHSHASGGGGQRPDIHARNNGGEGGAFLDLAPALFGGDCSTPAPLPNGFEWSTVDPRQPAELAELTQFMSEHYIEDSQHLVRLDYSSGLLAWALSAPGTPTSFAAAIKATASKRLMGFIGAMLVQLPSMPDPWLQVDFLCVHKRIRNKRMASVLIKEIVRRGLVEGNHRYKCGFFTSALPLPIAPVCTLESWERLLNPTKMFACGYGTPFMVQNKGMFVRRLSLDRQRHPYRHELVPMTEEHVPQVTKLLNSRPMSFRAVYDNDQTRHWLLPRAGVVETYVVLEPPPAAASSPAAGAAAPSTSVKPKQAPASAPAAAPAAAAQRKVSMFASYFHLHSKLLQHPVHKDIKLAHLWYYHAPTDDALRWLMRDLLLKATEQGMDMAMCTNQGRNAKFLEALQFGKSTSKLRGYAYNHHLDLQPEDVGIIMI
jgi:glycylpeptide N-tetradecanoyltransferase